jgi:hypothetical protein
VNTVECNSGLLVGALGGVKMCSLGEITKLESDRALLEFALGLYGSVKCLG